METKIPNHTTALISLLKADFTTQWRNRRSVVIILLVPVIILFSWKGVVAQIGGPFVLSSCITIGLMAIGLMGYSNAIARDRDKGVFQRLRVSPVPTWSIMVSRLLVQLSMILLTTVLVFITGYYFDGILLKPIFYLFSFFTALVGGILYLGLGQLIVGLVKNAETVNSTTRLVYFVFVMVGMLASIDFHEQNGLLGQIKQVVIWSPYGTVKNILASSMGPFKWNHTSNMALLASMVYAILFTAIGIKKFKWHSNK